MCVCSLLLLRNSIMEYSYLTVEARGPNLSNQEEENEIFNCNATYFWI